MKTTIALLVLFALVLGGGYWWSVEQNKVPAETVPVATTTDSMPSVSETPAPAAASSYTLAQVATHNNATSCWTAIAGNVYDLTSWIPNHPGGEARILAICGKDGTSAYMGQHGKGGEPRDGLASYKIGALAQ